MDELFKKKSLVVPVVTLDSSNPNLLFSEHVDSDKRSLDPCNTEPPFKRKYHSKYMFSIIYIIWYNNLLITLVNI